jgi:nicotinamidase-related amidase
MKTALVLIDIQNDYFEGGRKELSGPAQAADNAAEILRAARIKSIPVFHVRHISTKPGASFFLPETEGSEINSRVAPVEGETVVIKHFPNSFRDTVLEKELNALGIRRLVICGMMSHMCVDTTVRAAADLGYSCVLVHDACATCDLTFGGRTIPAEEVHASFMAALKGTFAELVTAEEAAMML